jgi:predicted metal-dependent phosphoesterase TrpH
VLKVELHAHTDLDPRDRIAHSTEELIDRAHALGFGALAVTLHDKYFDPAPFAKYACARGIVLMSGIERTVNGKHLLLINFPADCAGISTVDDLADLKTRTEGLVIAPHPFYPTGSALGTDLDEWTRVVDAVEINAMYTRQLDFNRKAVAWALEHRRPLVGNSDVHVLSQLGTTYSLVDAPPDADAICDAIRKGHVRVRSEPISWLRAGSHFMQMAWRGMAGRMGQAAAG